MGIFDFITKLSQSLETIPELAAHALRNTHMSDKLIDIVHMRSEHNLANSHNKVYFANLNQPRNAKNIGQMWVPLT